MTKKNLIINNFWILRIKRKKNDDIKALKVRTAELDA